MKVTIKANKIGEEEKRVENALKKANWYKEKGYFVVLPKSSVQEEYDATKYGAEEIIEEWRKEEKDFFKKISEILGDELQKEYEVCLTRYGVGGSYHLPNKIIVNIAREYSKKHGPVEIIKHEIIHLCIEPLIQKYKISHWRKERVVDLIASKIIASYHIQKIPVETRAIDEAFNKFFPDIEEIIKNSK